MMSSHRLGFLITLATAISYAVWPSAMRAAYADGANSGFVILVSMLARGLPLFIDCLAHRKPVFRKSDDIRSAMTGGFFQALSSGTALAAVIFLPGPLVVVIMFTHTLMLLGYLIWRGEAKPDAATILTTVAALIGLCFVLDLFHKQPGGNLIGMGLAFLSSVSIASRLYVYGQQIKSRPLAVVGTESFVMANLFTLPIILYQLPVGPHTMAGYGWMAAGCLSLALGTYGQFHAINLLGPFRYSLFLKLEPLFTTIFAAFLIGDILKPVQYFGIVMVSGSIALYQVVDHRRRAEHDKILSTSND